MTEKKSAAMMELVTLMANLRDPQHGCAWDRKQTFESLTRHTLEEVYEVVDAVEQGEAAKVCDELGDLLFQVVFYARIAEEQSLFDLGDVANAIKSKLLHRHPHIFPDGTLVSFGQPSPLTAEQVEHNWELIKNAEREALQRSGTVSVVDDVPRALPAIERAGKLQKRAASVGFDWPDVSGVTAKLAEESAELQAAIANGDQNQQTHELGDLLFTCVNLARHLKIDPEGALRQANQRFETRFRYVEKTAASHGGGLSTYDPEQLDLWWNEAKSQNN
ncbi:nucleoside triphosphate pyrophosphohydrolase [Pseudohongiella sp. SYSU M77423]|uniref:nucleoside triphosphate pyrophosphohydrolase n=1 Tax=Pseudohongiella sp. SYSU M77423 TaxID=3042312 RepID=UPI002480FA5F|nr:nucleoside triphosphate pyrophosphohydrolase [Pseudohongiella sp. SYSU M77423]MDH7943068.1 nucleoside triphosphate pyrophosphohydrolase [Pseudohongiella sp. SYSU M77423]